MSKSIPKDQSKEYKVFFRVTEDEYYRLKYHVRNTKQSPTNKVYHLLCQYIKDNPIRESDFRSFMVKEGILERQDIDEF